MSKHIQVVPFPSRRSRLVSAAPLRHHVLFAAGFLILAAGQGAYAQGSQPGTAAPPQVVLPGPVVEGINCLSRKQEVELALLRAKFLDLQEKVNRIGNDIRDMQERQIELAKTIRHLTDVITGKTELTDDEKANQVNPAEEMRDAAQEAVQIKIDIARAQQDLATTVNEGVAVADQIAKLEAIEKKCSQPPATTGPTPPAGGGQTGQAGSGSEGWTPRMAVFWDNSIEVVWEYKDGKNYTAEYFPNGTTNWTYKGDNPEYPSVTPPPMPPSMAGRPLRFKGMPTTATGPTPPAGGGQTEYAQTNVDPPKLPAAEAFPPATGPTPPAGGGQPDYAPTNIDPPKLPAAEAFGPPPPAIGPTTPLGGSAAGYVRVRDNDGNWFWIFPTGKSVVPADPNAIGPTAPLGGGWKHYQGADGKGYWISTGTTMTPAEPPPGAKAAMGPTTPLGGSAAGYVRVRDNDGKWFWILPTSTSMLPADPNAIGPTAPLGGGWKRFQGADGKAYWILTGTTMLPAEPPPGTRTTTGPTAPLVNPNVKKSAQKKQAGMRARTQAAASGSASPGPASSGPTSSDVANAIGTGVAVGDMLRGHGRGRGHGTSAQPMTMDRRNVGMSGKATPRATMNTMPSKGTSGTTINTTVGKPVIKGLGIGF